jgi:predicted nucleic acid-binding protein
VLIAVDTNVLLDQAVGDADVLDALLTLTTRLKGTSFIVPPTVLEELGYQFVNGDAEQRQAAEIALIRMREWRYEPLNLAAYQKGIAEQISFKLRSLGPLPDEEENDGLIIAEAALLGCQLLLSSDHHMIEAQQHPRFRGVLEESEVDGDDIVIGSPRTIVRRFYPSR